MSTDKFKSVNNDPIEIRAIPPDLPFKVYTPQSKLVVNDKDPNNFANGEYIASSSGMEFSPWKNWLTPIRLFDGKSRYWHGALGWGYGYKTGPYRWTGRGAESYIGGGTPDKYFTTKAVTGEEIAGEWIQIKLPYKLKLSKYVIQNYPGWPKTYCPWKFTMLGSNDDTNWVILDQQDIDARNTFDSNTKTGKFEISKEIQAYNTFRIVIEKAGAYINLLSQIELYGMKPPKPCMNLMGKCEENFQPYNNSMSFIEGLAAMSDPQPTSSVMSTEIDLLRSLTDFNDMYARYVSCNKDIEISDCPLADKVDKAEEDVKDKITRVTEELNKITQGKSQSEYDESHIEFLNKHKNIMKLRSELDLKLKEIYETDDSISAEHKRMFDGTAYTSLIMTVLATSTLFYLFKHL